MKKSFDERYLKCKNFEEMMYFEGYNFKKKNLGKRIMREEFWREGAFSGARALREITLSAKS